MKMLRRRKRKGTEKRWEERRLSQSMRR